MGHFISENTTRLDVGDGEWVEIKQKLSVGDYERIATESKNDLTEGRIVATLVTVIKAWNLKDDGKEMPLNRASIEKIDADLATRIIGEIGQVNKPSKKV